MQAIAAAFGAVFTFLIYKVYVGQLATMTEQSNHMRDGLIETKKAADAARVSADAAILAVEHADRPWIRVDLAPQTLVVSETEGLQITCGVKVKNIGKSVAEQVIVWDHLAIDPGTLRLEQAKLRDLFDRWALVENVGGMTIFPDEQRTQTRTVGTGAEAPERYWRQTMPDMLNRDMANRILPLTYIGCVGYRYGTSDRWHFTYWGYDLVSSDGRHLPLEIATGMLPQPPYLCEPFGGNLNRAT